MVIGTLLNESWYIDNEHVYDYQGNIMQGVNPKAFHTLDTFSDGFTSTGYGFATDGVHVYYDGSGKGIILTDADPHTFVMIRQAYQAYGTTEYNMYYEKDKSHVWYDGQLISGADPKTFMATGTIYDSKGNSTDAKDDSHVYGHDSKGNVTIDGVTVK